MKFIKYLLLFLIPAVFVATVIVAYFKVTQKIANIEVPNLPSISLSDVVKFSRFSLEKAPSQSLVGSIAEMTGEVKHEPRLATESAKIDKPISIQQGEILETGADGGLTLNFKDNAEVKIEEDSRVNVVQTLPANIVFAQTRGTATYKKLSNAPLSVRSMHLLIENGGEIKVSIDSEEPVITVVAVTGEVKIAFNNLNLDSQVITLEEGKTMVFNDTARRPLIENN
jgi:hypothetical protein